MNNPDLSTKLKLMGVDVGSFGDYFADEQLEKTKGPSIIKDSHAGPGPDGPDSAAKQASSYASNDDMATIRREGKKLWATENSTSATNLVDHATASPIINKHGPRDTSHDPIKCLTYHDPFSSTYKKYIFTADGQYLLGGIMIGDTGDFTKLVAIVKKKVRTRRFSYEYLS
jgi:nitrite reductase (NAD(P)H)